MIINEGYQTMKKWIIILLFLFAGFNQLVAANKEANDEQEWLDTRLAEMQSYFDNLGIKNPQSLLQSYKKELLEQRDTDTVQGTGQETTIQADESNNNAGSAVTIQYNTTETNYTAQGKKKWYHPPKNDQDWFKFNGQQGDHVTLYSVAFGIGVTAQITLLDAALNVIDSKMALPIGLQLPADGVYYIRIDCKNLTTSDKPYHLGLARMDPDTREPNNSFATATPLSINQNQAMGTNTISHFGEYDLFTFESPGNENLHVEINTPSGLTDLRPLVILYDATHHELKVGLFASLSNHDKYFDFWLANAGKYYLLVTSGVPVPFGIGEYEIILQGKPRLSIDDITVAEGNEGTTTGTFTVSLDKTNDTGAAITFDWSTADSTATGDKDYVIDANSGTIAVNDQTTTLDVAVLGDVFPESNEDFVVNLTNMVGAIFADDRGNCQILEDEVTIDSDRNIGFPPLVVNFYSHVPDGGTWQFGNGGSSPDMTPATYYMPGTWEPGSSFFNVSYDQEGFDDFVQIYEPGGYGRLAVVSGSPAEKYGWENAVDGDLHGHDGTTITRPDASGHPWAIFEFIDGSIRTLHTLRMMNNTGIGHAWHHVQKFQVWVSSTGMADNDFTLALETEKTNNITQDNDLSRDWQEWSVDPVQAKYIKLVLLEPSGEKWNYLGEFEAWFDADLALYDTSFLDAELDATGNTATVTLTLYDDQGDPLAGKTEQDIEFFAFSSLVMPSGHHDEFTDFSETHPGVYQTTLTPYEGGTKLLMASVNGVVIDKDENGNAVEIEFAVDAQDDPAATPGPDYVDNGLEFVQGSPAFGKGRDQRGWDNAIDGDVTGFDGSTWAKGEGDAYAPAWAIFKFADDQMYRFNQVAMQTDNGVADDGLPGLQTTVFEIMVSTTGIDEQDFMSVKSIRRVGNGSMRYYALGKMVTAKYVKLRLLAPAWGQGGYRQVVEFGVDTDAKGGAIPAMHKDAFTVLDEFALIQNYPNPFNPVTTIDYHLAEESPVSLMIYDVTGKLLEVLVNEVQQKGMHRVSWNANRYPSGVYFYQLQAGEFQATKRMMLIK
jgi:hypothetical protein